jgi:hypothetical protein
MLYDHDMRSIAMFTILAVALLSGCARSRITTEIKPDGSWLRTTTFTGQAKKEGMQLGSTIEETFITPSGNAWKSHDEQKGDDHTLTFERTVAAGESLNGDLSVKGDGPGKVKLVNEVRVTRAGPHRFEYRETLRWKGSPPNFASVKPENIEQIKAALPAPLATDANARALAQKAGTLFIPLIFGPGEPLLAIGLIHPDLAERRARQRIGSLMLAALQEQFGDKLSQAERRQVAQKLISDTFSTKPSPPDPSGASGSKDGLTPLMFIVKTPGRIISSNGEVDELTGEVYWALFPEAASLKNVVLTAIVE